MQAWYATWPENSSRKDQRPCKECYATDDEDKAGKPGENNSAWKHLLHKRDGCEDRYPDEVHDTTDEKQEHQRPATAHAVGAVLRAHVQRPQSARAHVTRDPLERRPAMDEAS